MDLTRRELLKRMAVLATALPSTRLIQLGDTETKTVSTPKKQTSGKLQLATSSIDMYCYYPDVKNGWICKECHRVNAYWNRECIECRMIETAIPESWTCSTCNRTQAWEKQCTCYRRAYSIKSKINPFWIG